MKAKPITVYVVQRMLPWDKGRAILDETPFMSYFDAMRHQAKWAAKGKGYTASVVVVESAPVDVRKHMGKETRAARRTIMNQEAP